MSREKYDELRRMRLKDLEMRIINEGIRIREQNEALRSRVKLGFLQRREHGKAEKVIAKIRKSIEAIKEKGRISEYVPKRASRIDDLLLNAEESYRSAKYYNVLDLSLEIQELIAKAEVEVSKIIEEEKRRRRKEWKYFYAVIQSGEKLNFWNIGVNDKEVYTIPYRDISALVSDTNVNEYELTEENTRRHESVLREVMEKYTLIPSEFSTVINSERILEQLLRRAYKPARECLKIIDNKVELGVKAIVNKDGVYFDKERGIKTAIEILDSLKKKAEQSVSGELFSEKLVLNESFLVKKEEVDAFSEEVSQLEEHYPMVRFLFSGPWPPYNFVYIRIGKEGIEFSKKR